MSNYTTAQLTEVLDEIVSTTAAHDTAQEAGSLLWDNYIVRFESVEESEEAIIQATHDHLVDLGANIIAHSKKSSIRLSLDNARAIDIVRCALQTGKRSPRSSLVIAKLVRIADGMRAWQSLVGEV